MILDNFTFVEYNLTEGRQMASDQHRRMERLPDQHSSRPTIL
jgi:hypothetical protein